MALTDYDFSLSRNQIIESAFQKVGVLSPGDSLPGEMFTQGLRMLNAMVKSWQSEHVFLWTEFSGTFTTSVGDDSYLLSAMSPTIPQVLWVNEVSIRDNGSDTPLDVIPYADFLQIADKDATGKPTTVACDNRNPGSLHLWPVPDKAYDIFATVVTRMKDLETGSDLSDFPPNWQLALMYGLAELLSDDYKLPLKERDRLTAKAQYYFGKARGMNVERVSDNCVCGSYRS